MNMLIYEIKTDQIVQWFKKLKMFKFVIKTANGL